MPRVYSEYSASSSDTRSSSTSRRRRWSGRCCCVQLLLLGLPAACALRPSNSILSKPKVQRPLLTPNQLAQAEDYCYLSDELPLYRKEDYAYDAALLAVPVLVPFASFFSYPLVQKIYHFTADALSGFTYMTMRDGGASQIAELLPVTNGIVVPSVSVAFGTLTAITIQTLRQRQITIRALLNKESCALRNLHTASRAVLAGAPYDRERLQTNLLLGEYATRLIFESRLGIDLEVLERVGASDSELDGITEVLYTVPERPREDGAPPPLFLQNTDFTAMNLLRDLQMLRSERLALLQTPFPAVHWLILTILAGSIVLAFLFETDLQVLQFLDDLQLRYLFTVLTSAFLALASLCVDLADPFRGSFTIAPSTSQLECIREYIREECALDEATQVTRRAAAEGGE